MIWEVHVMQDDMINMPYKLSDSEFYDLATTASEDDFFRQLFTYYPIECVNMQILYEQRIDKKIKKFFSVGADKEKLAADIVSAVSFAFMGKRQTAPIIFECVKSIKETIDSDACADVSTKEFADKYKISHYYLLHQFKRSMGVTVTDYKNELKLKYAKSLLLETQESVTDIAQKSGFGSSSYFSKIFRKYTGVSPSEYRRIVSFVDNDLPVFKLSKNKDKDIILYSMMPHIKLLDGVDIESLTLNDGIRSYTVSRADERYSFLHEAAIIEYKGVLFNAWYNSHRMELMGESPIRFSRSFDCGKSWTEPKTAACDESGRILYCPPVFGIDGGKLYMFINEMVRGDHMHALDLYVYNEGTDSFDMLWARPIPFKLNTNVYRLPNGKLMLPGRVGELDRFPNTPAVMISDSGKIDAEWRVVKLQEDGRLPDGEQYVHPETCVIVADDKIYLFSRNDKRALTTVYISEDNGETWSGPGSIDIPFSDSKIYSGTLSDGRNYMIGNLRPRRGKLAIFLSDKNSMTFREAFLIQDGPSEKLGYGLEWHYPSAVEYDGRLYITYSSNLDTTCHLRNLVVSVMDL